MNEENLTLLALDDYRSLIKQIRQMHAEGETFEEMDLQTKLSQQINEDAANKIIPERIVELKDDSNTTVDDMEHYINQIEDAYEQVTKSLDWNIDDFKDSGENKDSKDVLQGIKDLMTKYMDTYSKDEGMLSAVDEFSAIGDAIKHALEEKTISTTTALLLTEPLKHMKDHMFDSERQEKEAELFYDIINRQLDREDEKQGPEQDKEYAVNSTGSVLGNALRFLAESAEKIHNKFEKDANNVADKYDKEQAQKQAENSVKQPRSQEMPHKPDLEKKQQAKDVASNKNQDEMLREDKVLNEKSDQETPKTKKEALSELRVLDANIRKTLETFNNPSDEDKEKLKQQFVEFYTVLSNPNLKDLADEYYNRVVQNAAKGGLEDYNISELIDKEAAKKEEKKQEAKDVSQKPEEVMKKEDKIQETKEPEKIETKDYKKEEKNKK